MKTIRYSTVLLAALLLAAFLMPTAVQALATGKMYIAPGPLQVKTSGGVNKFLVSTAGVITMANSETLDNSTNGTIQATTAVWKQTYDSNDYLTVTLGASTAPVFDSVANGGAGSFTFSDPVIVTAAATTDALYLNGTASTTGDLIQLKAVDATLNGGLYLNCLGGAGSTAVYTIGEDGATAITSTGTTTSSLTITNNTAQTGDLVTLTADDDALTTGGYYVNCLGGTDHATQVFAIGEHGVLTFGDGGTIDGETGTDVLNLTESTVRVTGALDVTGTAAFLRVTESVTDGAETVVAGTDNNKHFLVSGAGGATTITLPSTIDAAYVGMTIWVTQLEDQNLKITGASDDSDFIYCLNKAGDADYVTFDQAGEKIGATAMCMCVAANKWLIVNMTGDDATLTVTDTD